MPRFASRTALQLLTLDSSDELLDPQSPTSNVPARATEHRPDDARPFLVLLGSGLLLGGPAATLGREVLGNLGPVARAVDARAGHTVCNPVARSVGRAQ